MPALCRYYTSQDVSEGDELKIYYGDAVWFEDATKDVSGRKGMLQEHLDDEHEFLAQLQI